jgi:hypothetical protein
VHSTTTPFNRTSAPSRTKRTARFLRLEVEARQLGTDHLHRIFLVPEYPFRRSLVHMALHQSENDEIMPALRAISARHGDAMIVPNTIVWREETGLGKLLRCRYEARNTAYVFQRGQVIHNYNEHYDVCEPARLTAALTIAFNSGLYRRIRWSMSRSPTRNFRCSIQILWPRRDVLLWSDSPHPPVDTEPRRNSETFFRAILRQSYLIAT